MVDIWPRVIACFRKRPLITPTLLKPPDALNGRLVDSDGRNVKQPPCVICADAAAPWRWTASVSARNWRTVGASSRASTNVRPSSLIAQYATVVSAAPPSAMRS